jgi:NAD(P)H dehydrogenase (quinone)
VAGVVQGGADVAGDEPGRSGEQDSHAADASGPRCGKQGPHAAVVPGTPPIAVTGSTGRIGSRVVRALSAAVAAGVQRVVYTSFLGAAADCTFTFGRDHFHTEAALAASGLRWTALRDAFYQDVLPSFVVEPGVLRGPAGDGAVAAVAVDDVAEVAATVLLDGTTAHDGQRHDLSGPAALTLEEVAATLTELSGHSVRYERETPAQAYASRAHLDATPFEVDGWVSTYTAVASGEMAPVTDTVQRLTGHPATSLRTTLERYPELLDGLRG